MHSTIQLINQVSQETQIGFDDIFEMLFNYGYCDQYGNLTEEAEQFYNLK